MKRIFCARRIVACLWVFALFFCACGNVDAHFTRESVKTAAACAIPYMRTVALTFDDGPTKITETVLDVLKEKNVKATFFVLGVNVDKNPRILRRIFDEGHLVGMHGYSHKYHEIYASCTALKSDINRCLCAIKGVNSNYEPKFYRFPGGSFSLGKESKDAVKSEGLVYVDWNASCRDSEKKSASEDELITHAFATSEGKNHVILLMHDAADKARTARALPQIIDRFKVEGFSFVTVEKLYEIS